MSGSAEVLAAIRELTTTKQLERSELLDLLRDGIQAALVRRYGPNVRFELDFDELKGTIRMVRLRQVVETVEDPTSQISLEEARYEDPEFSVGDMLEEDVPFAGVRPPRGAGRQAADHPAGARGRAHPDPRGVRRQGRRAALRRGAADRARQAGASC